MNQRFSSLNKIQSQFHKSAPLFSIGIRVKNESKAINDFWTSLVKQALFDELEIVFLDSGSTDGTLEYLKTLNCSIYTISSTEFSFGATCNLLMELTTCSHVVFLSGHVIIQSNSFFNVLKDFIDEKGDASGYFRQIPNLNLGCSIYDEVFLKYSFPTFRNQAPIYKSHKPSFSNAGSLISRVHWNSIHFKDVIASEDYLWAKEVIKMFGGVYYFHALNILHSHAESYKDVYSRVRINAKARYPNGINKLRRYYMFIKVFSVLFLNTGKTKESYSFALAHSDAYKI